MLLTKGPQLSICLTGFAYTYTTITDHPPPVCCHACLLQESDREKAKSKEAADKKKAEGKAGADKKKAEEQAAKEKAKEEKFKVGPPRGCVAVSGPTLAYTLTHTRAHSNLTRSPRPRNAEE